MQTVQINVRLDQSQSRKLGELAQATHRSRCGVLRLLVEQAKLSGQSDVVLESRQGEETRAT